MNAPPTVIPEHVIAGMMSVAASSPAGGAFLEVGVYRGGSAWFLGQLARDQGREIWLFDTFEGIPFKGEHDGHNVGDFGDTSLEAVRAALPFIPPDHFIPGVFPATLLDLPAFPALAFVHVDCDQYQSVADCITYLSPLMMRGGVMWFDDAPILGSAKKAVEDAFGVGIAIEHPCGRWYIVRPS